MVPVSMAAPTLASHIRRWLALGAALLALSPAWASPISIDGPQDSIAISGSTSFWIDPRAKLGPDQVAAQEATLDFEPGSASRMHRLEGAALWIRFELNVHDAGRSWMLELPVAGIDLAELFYRKADGSWVRQMAGDTQPQSTWPLRGRYPVFRLSPETGVPVPYYLRVQHARVPFSAPLVVIDKPRLMYEHERDHLLLGGYIGLNLLLVLLATVVGTMYRDSAFLVYALYIFLLALMQAAFTGIAAQYLWPERPLWGNVAPLLLGVLAAATALGLVRLVISPKQYAVALDRFLLALILILVVAGALDAWIPTVEGFAVNNILVTSALTLIGVLISLALYEGDRNARWVGMGFLPVLASVIFPVLRNYGILPSSALTANALLVGSALEAPILFFGLYWRLTDRREAMVRSSALSQNDPLTGLTLERVLIQRLHAALLRARRYTQQCALVVVDLSNYDSLAVHGRAAAERSLVVAASRLRAVVRDVDTAARIGDHQYALLLEAPGTKESALSVATHVVARGLHASINLPPGETLRFRVVVALLPWGNLDAEQALDEMRRAMADLNGQSPKTIVSLNF